MSIFESGKQEGITRREFLSFVGGATVSTIVWNVMGFAKIFPNPGGQTATVLNSYGNSVYGGTTQ